MLKIGSGPLLLGKPGLQIKASSAAAFTPATLSPSIWLKADAITGKVDGDAISQWNDSSGNANHAAQATGSKQPLYKTGIQNSLPVVRFDGTDDNLVVASFASLSGKQAFDLYAVIIGKHTTTQGIAVELTGNTDNVTDGFYLFQGNGTTSGAYRGGFKGDVGYTETRSTSGYASAAALVRFNGDKSKASAEATLRLNRTDTGTQTFNSNNTNTFASSSLNIGQRGGDQSARLSCDFCELLIFDSTLSNANRDLVETYLKTRWGTP